jgi:hypothetical protein
MVKIECWKKAFGSHGHVFKIIATSDLEKIKYNINLCVK